jgi:hypothetical protein
MKAEFLAVRVGLYSFAWSLEPGADGRVEMWLETIRGCWLISWVPDLKVSAPMSFHDCNFE